MAKLFEKDTIRLLKSIDTIMLLLRQAYQNDPENFDLVNTARLSGLVGDVATEFGQITANGYLIQTTSGPLAAPIYLGDRKHFIAQMDNPKDELFIGDPVSYGRQENTRSPLHAGCSHLMGASPASSPVKSIRSLPNNFRKRSSSGAAATSAFAGSTAYCGLRMASSSRRCRRPSS